MSDKFPEIRNKELLKRHALASGALSLMGSLIFIYWDFPFTPYMAVLAFVAGVLYLVYYSLFDFLCGTCLPAASLVLSLMGVGIVTFAVLFTGGMASPFVFLYFSLLVAESLYGLQNPYTMPACMAGYLIVTVGLFLGIFPNYAPWSVEIYRSKPAVFLIVSFTASYILITGGMSNRILSFLRGKLEEDAAEKEALIRKFSELNSTAQLGVLAHRIAHDMRGPIASISGYLEMEAAKTQSPEDRETLRDVQETVDAMVESLHSITRFGKPGGPSCEKICLADLMRDLVGIASFAPMARGVKFDIVSGEGNSICVTVSRADLQQAIFNILKNAVEAVAGNHDAREIHIAIQREGKEARVTVSDNGPGVPEETLKSLFRKSVTTKADGTGVGLMITRDLLVRNKGDIKLRNREGGGFIAEISLPLA